MSSTASPGRRRPSNAQPARPTVVMQLSRAVQRAVLEMSGWVLLVTGLAAIPLPGPGLLITFAGLLLLSRQHTWARRRVDTVRVRALRGAAHSVASWARIVCSFTSAAALGPVGVLWIVSPPPPGWWMLPPAWWLPGGTVVGASQLLSALVALAVLGYSCRRFRNTPESLPPISAATSGVIEVAVSTPTVGSMLSAPAFRAEYVKEERRELLFRCLCA